MQAVLPEQIMRDIEKGMKRKREKGMKRKRETERGNEKPGFI